MTPEEHQLVAEMLAKQFHYIKLLIEILQSKEIIQGDDLAAFLTVSRADEAKNASLLRVIKGEYRMAAKGIGLKVSFPKAR